MLPETAPTPISTATLQLTGGVRVELTLPAAPQPAPALLLLHGATGLLRIDAFVPHLTNALAEQGFATLLVHYFDATGTSYADDATIWKHFETWLKVVHEAVTAAEQHSEIAAGRIGLVGYSLGGYLAMAHAARDRRIRAVVEFAGGMDVAFAQKVTHLPPTMLVHGERDRRVPFARALELKKVLERVGAEHETRFYPEDGHFFSAPAGLDALEAGVTFLQKHLGSGA